MKAKVKDRLKRYEGQQLFLKCIFRGSPSRMAEYTVTGYNGAVVIDTRYDDTADGLLVSLLNTAYQHGWALRVMDGALVSPMMGRRPTTILAADEYLITKEDYE